MINKSLKIDIDNIEKYLIIVFLIISPVISFMKDAGLNGVWLYLFILIIMYLPLSVVVIMKHNLSVRCVLLFFTAIIYILINSKLHPEFDKVYSDETNGILTGIITGYSSVFALLFFGVNYHEQVLLSALKNAAVFNVCISFVKLFTVTLKSTEYLQYGYSMSLGYLLLFSIIVFILFSAQSKVYLIISIILSLIMVFVGSRGPILCLFIFVLLYFHFEYKAKCTKKQIIIFYFCAFFAISIIYLLLFYVFPQLDLSGLPRSIRDILELPTRISSIDYGRLMIRDTIWDYLKTVPFFGYGMLSDQGFLGVGLYSHNIFLEIFMTFGFLIGSIMILKVFKIVFGVFFNKNLDNNQKIIFSVFFSMAIGRLLVSYSFWYDSNFWCMLGLGIVLVQNAKRRVNYEI